MQKLPYCGCSLCGRPVLEDHTLCSLCELDKKHASAIIYEFPSGRIIKNPRKTLSLPKKE